MIPYQVNYRIMGLLIFLSVAFTKCKKVHELMTDDEITNLFQTTRDKVPEYDVVTIEHSLHKRSASRGGCIKFKAFETEVQAALISIDGILLQENTPVWVAENSVTGIHYRKLKTGIMKDVLGIYQGVSDRAAFVVESRDRRNIQFRGTIQNFVVAPLPVRLQPEIMKTDKRKRDLSKANRTLATTRYHIVFKSNEGHNQATAAQQSNETAAEKNEDFLNQIDVSRSKRSQKYMVFPTILVTTDFNIAMKSKDDIAYYDQLIYQMAFWNSVDLRFRHLSNPKVRLRIAGIVIGSTRSATPYLKQNMDNGQLDVYGAMKDMQAYWGTKENNTPLREGFHIVATRSLEMFSFKSGLRNKLKGLAATSSICTGSSDTFYPSMLSRDNYGFDGIDVAVHELAHVLGAYHDHRGDCPSTKGYLMSSPRPRTYMFPRWSNCSLYSMERTLRLRNCTDKPIEQYSLGEPLGRVLPGTLKTTHQQCKARGFDTACVTTPDVCRVLQCYKTYYVGIVSLLNMCSESYRAADGTECAPGSFCLDGECLLITKEILRTNEIQLLLVLITKVLLGPYDTL